MGRCWRQSYEVVKRSKPSAAVSRNAVRTRLTDTELGTNMILRKGQLNLKLVHRSRSGRRRPSEDAAGVDDSHAATTRIRQTESTFLHQFRIDIIVGLNARHAARRRGNNACACVRRLHGGKAVCVSAAHALTAEYLHRRPLPPRPLMRRAIYRTHVHPTSVRRCNPTEPAIHSAIDSRRSSLLCASDPSDINSEVN
ncbi:hypothetical protein RR46_09430 [Papilio xuthus]|uniref:Uncharacterized protein n=1 Tax=Papilio xuthus TaxID=66420 RepID=A0A194PZP4_PAPXU|nr:hypothetical protein RR46_09430 [Papilio xuthus]